MSTQQLDATHSGDDLALALAVIYRRISSLPKEDRNDLKELFAEFAEASTVEDDERCEAARRGIAEVLNRAPTTVRIMEVPEGSGVLEKWADFIGKRIRALRSEAGLTQEQLSERSGIAQGYISRLEQGQHTPNALTLQKLARGLGIPVDMLDIHASSANA